MAYDIEDWHYRQLENTTHLLHGVIHTNWHIGSLMDWICFELPSELRNNVVECLQVARVYSVPGPVQVIPYQLSANVSFSRDMLPQPTPGLNSCNWGSNLASSSELERRRHLQLTLGSLIQNSNISIYQEATSIYQEAKKFVDNISFEEGMKNYHGQWAPCVTGVSYSAAATTNQQAPRVGSTFGASPCVPGSSYSWTTTNLQPTNLQRLVWRQIAVHIDSILQSSDTQMEKH